MLAVSAGSKRNNLFLASDDGAELVVSRFFTKPVSILILNQNGRSV